LSFNAGFINSTGVMGFTHKAISHVTGTVTLNAIALSQASEMLETGMLVGAFFIGAVACGAIVGGTTLKFGRRYGVALLLESTMLLGAWHSFRLGSRGGEFLAAMACGLQNAMVASMSGSIVRTTHLTGIVTDLGHICGDWLCGRKVIDKHPLLLFIVFLAFYAGAMAGAFLYPQMGYLNILFASVLTGLLGLIYLGLRIFYGKVKKVPS
jgi:uncharacterized membrane protein YoaK (UPF0700 family)